MPMPPLADRLPPHSIEAEQGVLGCILLAPNECLSICATKLRCDDCFYDMRHQALYAVMMEMFQAGQVVDPLVLQQILRDRNQLEALGGMPYIVGLMNCVPSAASLEYYIPIIQDKYLARRLIQSSASSVTRLYDGDAPQAVLDALSTDVITIGQERENGETEDPTIQTLVQRTMDRLDEYVQNQGQPRGLTVGFPDLDGLTSGFMPGSYVVIAARPSVGKTSLAMNMAENVAVTQRKPVQVYSMEMTADELIFRLTCSRARVDSKKARDGYLTPFDFPKLTTALGEINASPLHICEKGGMTIRQIMAHARRAYQRHHIELIVIDYVQLMQAPQGFKGNRNEALTAISNGIKTLAKELRIPIIVIAQINRDVERQERLPRPSDLKDCGAIEQDADIILMLHPDEKQQDTYGIAVKGLLPKNRNGPNQTVEFTFIKSYTRYESASRVSDAQI